MSDSKIGNSELISQVNSRLILQAVRIMQPTYRAAMARKTGLKPATVTVIVNDLLNRHMLIEVPGPATSDRWGRPPLMLRVNGDVKHILAIDLEPDCIRVALTNILVENLVYRETRIDRFAKPSAILPRILELCDQVLGGISRRAVMGVGVSLPGLIEREQGVLISSTNMPEWRDIPVGPILHKKLRLPVQVERSMHCALVYEDWSNPRPSDHTTLIVSLRTGVGMSFIHAGQRYIGNQGFDGEIGHTVIDVNGKPCECGSRGCLETFISASAITGRARDLVADGKGAGLKKQIDAGEELVPELIYRLASEGDEQCISIVREVGKYLGIAVANMINLLAPHEVVISGSIDIAGELILQAVTEQVQQRALARTREKTTIRLAQQTDKLPLLGAAAMVAQRIFALPKLSHNVSQPRVRQRGRRRKPRPDRAHVG